MREVNRAQLGFADLELRQWARVDPVRRQSGAFRDAQGAVLDLVHRALTRQLKHRRHGRTGMSAEQVRRSFVLMRLKSWDYRARAERLADGYTLRLFTRFDGAPVPRHDAFPRGVVQWQVDTLRRINQGLVKVAVKMGLEQVSRLRLDTTVVETDIRCPRDSGMLWDTVRVCSRLVDRISALVPGACKEVPRRSRRARRRMQEIARMRQRAQRRRTRARK